MSSVCGGFFKHVIDDDQVCVLRMYFPYTLVYDHLGRLEELALEPTAYVIRDDGISVGVELTDEEVLSGKYLLTMARILGDDKLLELIESVGEDWVKPDTPNATKEE